MADIGQTVSSMEIIEAFLNPNCPIGAMPSLQQLRVVALFL